MRLLMMGPLPQMLMRMTGTILNHLSGTDCRLLLLEPSGAVVDFC